MRSGPNVVPMLKAGSIAWGRSGGVVRLVVVMRFGEMGLARWRGVAEVGLVKVRMVIANLVRLLKNFMMLSLRESGAAWSRCQCQSRGDSDLRE